jgi:hypothetical protein
VYVLRFRERLSIKFPFCVLPAGEECLIRRKRNGNSVGVSGERNTLFYPIPYSECRYAKRCFNNQNIELIVTNQYYGIQRVAFLYLC